MDAGGPNAFSPRYPVILTLENHCKAKGQDFIAETLRAQLGDALHVPTAGEAFSPAALEGKVVIRDKRREEGPDVKAYAAREEAGVSPTKSKQHRKSSKGELDETFSGLDRSAKDLVALGQKLAADDSGGKSEAVALGSGLAALIGVRNVPRPRAGHRAFGGSSAKSRRRRDAGC